LTASAFQASSTLATATAWIGIITFITTSLGLVSGGFVLLSHMKDAGREHARFAQNLLIIKDQLQLATSDIEEGRNHLGSDSKRMVGEIVGPAKDLMQDMMLELTRGSYRNQEKVTQSQRWYARARWIRASPKLDDMMTKMGHLVPNLFEIQMVLISASVCPK
jgi:hypothetical protein